MILCHLSLSQWFWVEGYSDCCVSLTDISYMWWHPHNSMFFWVDFNSFCMLRVIKFEGRGFWKASVGYWVSFIISVWFEAYIMANMIAS